MTDITELVDLPDPAVQPLVHPLDLPQAAGAFRASWWVGALASPAAGLGVATIAWFASRSWVAPLIAGTSLVGFGALAGRYLQDQAWAFVPRRRQDRGRAVPLSWQLGAGLVLAAVLSVAVLLLAVRLAQPDVPSEVAEVTFGMGAAAGVLVAVDLLSGLARRRGDRQGGAVAAVIGLAAILASTVAANRVLFGAADASPSANVAWGAGAMLAVGAAVGGWKRWTARRTDGARRA